MIDLNFIFAIIFSISAVITFAAAIICIRRGKEWFSFGFLLPILIILAFTSYSLGLDKREKISAGDYYTNKCKLIETNISNGFLSSNTNRLDCNGVIENVNVDDYNSAIKTYQASLK